MIEDEPLSNSRKPKLLASISGNRPKPWKKKEKFVKTDVVGKMHIVLGLAREADIGFLKKIHTWAPLPDLDLSTSGAMPFLSQISLKLL